MSPHRPAFSSPSLMLFLLLSRFQILDINVKATALMTKAVVPEMEKRGYKTVRESPGAVDLMWAEGQGCLGEEGHSLLFPGAAQW